MEQIYDVAVLGGGPGGYTAALYCARAGLSTVVLEKLSPGGQMATTSNVENYPGFAEGVDGFDLAMQMKDGAERFGVETLFADATAVALEGGVKSCRAPQIYLTLVDNTEDHLSGELTVRQLSIGNDDENAEDGLKVSGELATGSEEDFADMETDNTTPDPSRLIFADGATATQGGTDSTNSAGGSGSGASDSADNTTVLYIVIAAVCVVVVAGVIVAVVLSKKKKGGSNDQDGQQPPEGDIPSSDSEPQ